MDILFLSSATGFDRKKQCVVHHRGPGIEDISGTDFLDNHSVNLLSSFLTALFAPKIALSLWNRFTEIGHFEFLENSSP